MTVLEVGLAVGLAIVIVWGSVIYLLQMVKIEKLEHEIGKCNRDFHAKKYARELSKINPRR